MTLTLQDEVEEEGATERVRGRDGAKGGET